METLSSIWDGIQTFAVAFGFGFVARLGWDARPFIRDYLANRLK